MKNQFVAYHFTGKIHAATFPDFYRKITDSGGIICYDLEDSLDTASGENLKGIHREYIISGLISFGERINSKRVGIRINKTGGSDFYEDIKGLRRLKDLGVVFLPKVESREEIRYALQQLPLNIIEVIPIIESCKAFELLDDITAVNDTRFHQVAFRHCDYNLSLGNFPFFIMIPGCTGNGSIL